MSITEVPDTAPWARVASRAVHPSNCGIPSADGLLVDIAAGIGRITVPVTGGASITRELLLDSPAYEVWLMVFPTGSRTAQHVHSCDVAVHVVCGAMVHERDGGPTEMREGTSVYVAAGTSHALRCLEAATTIHVHAKEQP